MLNELNLTLGQTAILIFISSLILMWLIASKQPIDLLDDFNKACIDNEQTREELKQTVIASRQGAYLQIEHH